MFKFKNIIRAHMIASYDFKPDVSRIKRAYIERGIRFFYIEFDRTLKKDDILEFFQKLKKFMNDNKITPGFIKPETLKNDKFFYLKNIIAATVLILYIIYIYTKCLDGNISFLKANTLTFAIGFFITAMISNDFTMNGFQKPHFVKLCFYVPAIYIFAFLVIYKDFKINWTIFTILVLLYIIGTYRLTFEYAPKIELKIRNILEEILIARPRFKELITQPIFLLGIYMLKNKINAAEYLISIGLLSQLSILNTFFHVHTPISISILRVLYGILFGFLTGIILKKIYFNKKSEVYVVGYFGFQNFGDELIKKALSEFFEENKFKYSFMENRKLNVLKLINSKCIIFAGGVFQDKTSFLSFLFYSSIFFIAWICGTKCILLSYESLEINNAFSKALFNLILKLSYLKFSRFSQPDISLLYISKFKPVENTYDVISVKNKVYTNSEDYIYFLANKKEDISGKKTYIWNSVDDAIEFLAKSKKIITERFHVALIGLYFNKEVIPVNSKKTIHLVKEFKKYNIQEFKTSLAAELCKILNV
ncbi:MAG: DUF5693 family protein [Candidatus Aenigmarchaeota archaeon]|nr:DUF5693 family protein [Candidatus Aenigmarchaeota archaeon]MDW8149814.1 DUF5693 family protein [Candidatus Aenigmarchaeota archaeon]